MQQHFEQARATMVEGQLRPNKVTDPALLTALREVPREKFLPPALRDRAYVDASILVSAGRCLAEPLILARLLQAAGVQKSDTVLDIGCGTGYSTALLGRLARSVTGLESDAHMAKTGTATLSQLGINNARIVHRDDVSAGWDEKSPYNVILMNGAVSKIPQEIKSQMAEGGRIVAVLSGGGRLGGAVLLSRHGKKFSTEHLFEASLPLLAGFEDRKGFVF